MSKILRLQGSTQSTNTLLLSSPVTAIHHHAHIRHKDTADPSTRTDAAAPSRESNPTAAASLNDSPPTRRFFTRLFFPSLGCKREAILQLTVAAIPPQTVKSALWFQWKSCTTPPVFGCNHHLGPFLRTNGSNFENKRASVPKRGRRGSFGGFGGCDCNHFLSPSSHVLLF